MGFSKIWPVFFVLACCFLAGPRAAGAEPGEKITYLISPVGVSVYCDEGPVDLDGRRVNLVTFKTRAWGFDDLEKIYSDPETQLPLKVERFVSFLFKKEHLVEEYRPQEKTLSITKYVNGKVVATYHFKADGPIHNAVILPFSLRNVKDLKTGWTFTARLPDPIKIELVAIENIEVPAGAFKAYHFTSDPKKVEIWISCDEARIPVKIKGFGGYDYTLVMEKVEKGSLVR